MNITEVQSFLGFTGYYHHFIPKFAQVAWPLHELTLGENAGKCPFLPMQIPPILSSYPTDACGCGLGAVLYQTHKDGTDALIAYASRSLSKSESHYPAHKLEFPTLK